MSVQADDARIGLGTDKMTISNRSQRVSGVVFDTPGKDDRRMP